jgi:hypothetical protein
MTEEQLKELETQLLATMQNGVIDSLVANVLLLITVCLATETGEVKKIKEVLELADEKIKNFLAIREAIKKISKKVDLEDKVKATFNSVYNITGVAINAFNTRIKAEWKDFAKGLNKSPEDEPIQIDLKAIKAPKDKIKYYEDMLSRFIK